MDRKQNVRCKHEVNNIPGPQWKLETLQKQFKKQKKFKFYFLEEEKVSSHGRGQKNYLHIHFNIWKLPASPLFP